MVVHYWRGKPDRGAASREFREPGVPHAAADLTAATPAAERDIDDSTPTFKPSDQADDPTDGTLFRHSPAQVVNPPTAGDADLSASRVAQPLPVPSLRKSINPDDPFRVFADLNPAAARVWWAEVFRVGLALVAIALIVRWTSGSYDFTHVPWKSILTILGAATVLAAINWIERLRRFTADSFARPRAILRALERVLINKR
jgi:hypothetical protein